MARKIRIDMAGRRFGRLVGIGYAYSRGGHAYWLFQCDCGAETIVNGASVRAGKAASCGCLHREISAARLTVHGHRAAKRHDPTYRAWQAMNDSCANPASPRYRTIGARGIAVCPAWRTDYEAFLADMGERPAATMLARTDPAYDFGPANCRWVATPSRAHRAIAGWRGQAERAAEPERAYS